MIRNYFKTTFRHIKRNKINFIFKTGGLTLALFSLLIISIYVSHQWSFDQFHEEHGNIYRVNSIREEDGKSVRFASVPPAIGPALSAEFPEVAAYTRLGFSSRVMVQYKEKLFRIRGFVEADSSIFKVLSFKFVKGNTTALQQPSAVVLTQSLARQIFGDEDPINKVITSPDHSDRMLTVTAVVEDFPSNSHLVINAIHSIGSLMDTDWKSWEVTWDGSVNLYVRLAPHSEPDRLSEMALPVLRKNLVKTEDGSERNFRIYLQPISSIYLGDVLKMDFNNKGNAQYVYIFSVLGLFLLIIASINYVNLSIADFDTRTREIGVRKVLGARKRQIGFQIAIEAVAISIIALIAGIGLLYVLFPTIAVMLDPNLRFDMLWNTDVMLLCIFMIILLVITSTAYPSYVLALQTPAQDLKSNASYGTSMNMGKALLIAQSMISVICICATVVVGRQISFLRESDLGYDRSNVVSLVMPDEYPPERISVLKNEMSRLAGVEAVSYSYYLMPISTYFKGWYQIEKNGAMDKMLLNEMFVDHDYFRTMGIQLSVGRNFSKEYPSDPSQAFIINETAVREFGWTDPIGKRITSGYPGQTEKLLEGSVIGVVKDFHTLSLHSKIEPVVLRLQYDSWPGNSLNIRVSGSLTDALPSIVATYEKVMPGFLADVRVVEDLYERQYQGEDRAFASLQIGTVVIILISAFGIFSLSLYMSVRRMKEFGIRKVLGASLGQIALLHVSYFLKLVLIANLVALPLAYLLMKEWLNDFAYRRELSMIVFLTVACISCLLVIIAGGYSALKAGRLNPVDVIKTE